jgi:hypothetical protein
LRAASVTHVFGRSGPASAKASADRSPVTLPDVRVRLYGGHRFLRRGAGVVYLPGPISREFWRLDLQNHATRRIASFTDPNSLRTFDISPDGGSIVFERTRENSDIALIELPKKQ